MNEKTASDGMVEDEVWQQFAIGLGAVLSIMGDDDVLRLHLPGGLFDPSVVTITSSPTQRRAGLVSDAWGELWLDLDADDGPTVVSAFGADIVELLRDEACVPHPSLLTVEADGPCRSAAGILRLADHAHVDADHVAGGDDERTVAWLASSEALREAMMAHLRRNTGDDSLELDAEGDVRLDVDGVSLCLRILADQPAMLIFAPVVEDVRSRRQADIEVNILNRDSVWMRWCRRDRIVWQEWALPLQPFVPWAIDQMITGFATTLAETRRDLHDRLTGGARR